jgi:hypothetical protein
VGLATAVIVMLGGGVDLATSDVRGKGWALLLLAVKEVLMVSHGIRRRKC